MVSSILELNRDGIRYVGRPQKPAVCIGVFVMAFATCTSAQTEDPTQTEANTAVTDFCTSRIYTDSVAEQLQRWITQTATAAEELTREAKTLALAASIQLGTAKGPAYAFLSTIATSRAKEAADIASGAAAAATAALEAIKQRQGELAAHYALHKEAATLKAKAHTGSQAATTIIGASVATGGHCTVTTEATPYISETCNPTAPNHIAAAKIGTVLKKATKLKIGKTARLVLSAPTIKIEADGNLGTRANWKQTADNAACEVTGAAAAARPAAASAGVALHTVATTAATVVEELELKDPESKGQQQDQTQNNQHVLIQDKTIVAAVLAAQRSYKQPPKKVSEETVETLSATIQAQRLAVYLAIKEGAKIKLEENKDKIAVAIFGMKEGGINDKFFEPLKKETVTMPTENDPIK
uniref:Variant surface glycoprotein 1125.4996 n=1 Tax=Trypanosoma brucei TaxID=5691 RepID=A0A1J0RBL8_9TRYP|nr:variant surface glycoprotein 1125.4996 [Trypanosoma brucei]